MVHLTLSSIIDHYTIPIFFFALSSKCTDPGPHTFNTLISLSLHNLFVCQYFLKFFQHPQTPQYHINKYTYSIQIIHQIFFIAIIVLQSQLASVGKYLLHILYFLFSNLHNTSCIHTNRTINLLFSVYIP